MKDIIVIGMVVLVLAAGLFWVHTETQNNPQVFMTESEIIRTKRENTRVWQTNSSNVRYFKTCIEGNEFLATRATHNYIQLAGPTGKCDI